MNASMPRTFGFASDQYDGGPFVPVIATAQPAKDGIKQVTFDDLPLLGITQISPGKEVGPRLLPPLHQLRLVLQFAQHGKRVLDYQPIQRKIRGMRNRLVFFLPEQFGQIRHQFGAPGMNCHAGVEKIADESRSLLMRYA